MLAILLSSLRHHGHCRPLLLCAAAAAAWLRVVLWPLSRGFLVASDAGG